MRWLGALLLAAQLPQAPHLPIWVAGLGLMLVGVRLAAAAPRPRGARRAAGAHPVVGARAVRRRRRARDPRSRSAISSAAIRRVAFLFILVGIKFLETRTLRDGTLLVCLACFLLDDAVLLQPVAVRRARRAARRSCCVGATLDVLARPGAAPRLRGDWRAPLRRSARC